MSRTIAIGQKVLLVAGAASGLFFLASLPWRQLNSDETQYHRLAGNVAAGHGLSLNGESPTAVRPPLYPLFAGAAYKLAGPHPLSVLLLQWLLHCGTAGLVFIALRRQMLAKQAALFVVLYPSLAGFASLLMGETLFTFWFTLAILLGMRVLQTGQWWLALSFGLVAGLSALTRTVGLALLVGWLVVLPAMRHRPGVRPWRLAIAAVLPVAVLLGAWGVRNLVQVGGFIISDSSAQNIYIGNSRHAPLINVWTFMELEKVNPGYDAAYRLQPESARVAAFYRLTWQEMREAPGRTLLRLPGKAIDFLQPERFIAGKARNGSFWGITALPLAYGLAALCNLFYFGLVVALLRGWRWIPRTPEYRFIIAVALFYLIAYCIFFAHPHYHLPLVPSLVLLAATAWQVGWQAGKSPRRQHR